MLPDSIRRYLMRHQITRWLELVGALSAGASLCSFIKQMDFAKDAYTQLKEAPAEYSILRNSIVTVLDFISSGVSIYRSLVYPIFSLAPFQIPHVVVDLISTMVCVWTAAVLYGALTLAKHFKELNLNREIILILFERDVAPSIPP